MKTSHLLVSLSILIAASAAMYNMPQDQSTLKSNKSNLTEDQGDGKFSSLPANTSREAGQTYVKGLNKHKKETSALWKEVNDLRSEVLDLRLLVSNAITQTNDQGDNTINKHVPETVEEMEDVAEEQAQKHQQYQTALADIYQEEQLDEQWSSTASQLISHALDNKALENTNVYGFDCRSNMCRLEIGHDNSEAADTFNLEFPLQLADALPQMVHFKNTSEEGEATTILYLIRDGYDLP